MTRTAIFNNWGTTLTGAILAGLEAVRAVESGDPKDWAFAAALAILGVISRQWNVSSEQSK